MPVISNLILTNQLPVHTYTASVVTSGSVIADGLGNQITFLQLTCSYSHTASIQTSWEESSSFSSASFVAVSASFASRSLVATSASFSSASFVATSASFASASATSSYSLNTSNVSSYVTLTTSSTNWVTCSFLHSNESVTFISSAVYSFTASNMPSNGQVADVILHISQSSTSTSSLSFPASWVNLGTGWPTQITSSKIAVVWLRAMDNWMIMGTYNVQS